MTPKRIAVVGMNVIVEEPIWTDRTVVYVNDVMTEETFGQAVDRITDQTTACITRQISKSL